MSKYMIRIDGGEWFGPLDEPLGPAELAEAVQKTLASNDYKAYPGGDATRHAILFSKRIAASVEVKLANDS